MNKYNERGRSLAAFPEKHSSSFSVFPHGFPLKIIRDDVVFNLFHIFPLLETEKNGTEMLSVFSIMPI